MRQWKSGQLDAVSYEARSRRCRHPALMGMREAASSRRMAACRIGSSVGNGLVQHGLRPLRAQHGAQLRGVADIVRNDTTTWRPTEAADATAWAAARPAVAKHNAPSATKASSKKRRSESCLSNTNPITTATAADAAKPKRAPILEACNCSRPAFCRASAMAKTNVEINGANTEADKDDHEVFGGAGGNGSTLPYISQGCTLPKTSPEPLAAPPPSERVSPENGS
mmetsp:Transcript_32895/g.94454  ORF Transcript_32895/g.94454 Transcript_32895/m.94454 type:complete len:225 (+) Transcript_32895:42-716(+)